MKPPHDRKPLVFKQSDGSLIELHTQSHQQRLPESPRNRRWRPWRWLGGFAIASLLLAGLLGLQVLRKRSQVDRAWKEVVASRIETDGQPDLQPLIRYVELRPDDLETMADLVELISDSQSSKPDLTSALLIGETILRQQPQRNALRRTVIEIALKLERHKDAVWHLQRLREHDPRDAEMAYLLGQSHLALNQSSEAMRAFLTAIDLKKNDLKNYRGLAKAFQISGGRLPHREDFLAMSLDEDLHAVFLPKRLLPLFKAGDTIEALTERLWNYAIDTVEQRGDALLEKSRWLVEVGRLGEARAVCEEALRLDPANPQLQQAAAEWEMAGIRAESESISSSATAEKRERLRRAESLVEQAIAQTAADFALWLLRAEIQMYEGRPRQAEDTLRKGWSLIAAAEKSSSINADSPENMETKDFAKLEARFVWALANLIVQQMENDSAGQPQRLDEFERLLQRLESLSVPAANVDYLRGRSLFAQQRWHSARQVLAEASREMDRRSSILGHLHLLLSKSNRRLGLFEQEVSVLRDAIENSRDSASIRLQMADLLRSHGEVSEASEWLEWLPVEDYGDASRLARVTILCEAARPPANRRPHVLEAAIQHAKRCGVPAAEMAFYEADVALLLQKPDEAGRILESLRDAQPDHPEAWVMLALFHARHPDGNGFAQANTILRNAEQHLGPDPSFFRARLIIVVNLPQAEAISALTQLAAEPLASLPSSADLAFELAAAFEHCGQITAAHHWFRMAANHAPINLRYRFESARLLAALGRWPEFENSLIQLGEIEGADGPLGGYLRAVAVIVAREQKILQQKEIQSAHEHLDAAEEARWRWYFVPLARSILLHLEHNREAAGLQREHAEQLAAAAGRTIRDTSPPSQALLGSEVFPVGEWTRDIMSQPLIAFYLDETSLTFVKFDESSGVNSEDAGRTAQLAFAGIDFERITLTSGNSGSAHEQAETRVTAGLRSIVDQVADSKSSISTRVFVVTLASLGLVLVVNTILFERVGPFWGLLILIPGSLITFPVCYICLSWFFQNFL